ncbi:MAG: hypothetical protein NUW01_05690 [Gemmatimonadaceae bacterium]|nr:hypothetical protein [Gemmatimonadaceae bacterium]
MVSLTSLLIPILVSAVVVFLVSFILHMVIPFHRSDIKKIPGEDEFLAAIRGYNLPAGDYAAPHADSPAAMKDPAFVEKRNKGPIVIMTTTPGGAPPMSVTLTKWFIYCVVVSLFSAYIASRTLSPGTEYLQVFRIVGTAAFMGYALALLQNWIWWMKDGGATFRSIIDGLAYALATAGVFGSMWPAA